MTRPHRWELPAAIVLGSLADALLGDPRRMHPVAGFGRLAHQLERLLWRPRRAAGAGHVLLLVGSITAGCALCDRRLAAHRSLRLGFRAFVVWTVLGGRSLWREATLLANELDEGTLEQAHLRAPALVGRDPSELDYAELSRAVVESVAENTGDAVVAPLLWCAVAGAPAAVAYRAVNTLDAMIGHRDERYREFGWAAARLDDLANWPAARLAAALTILLAPLAGGTIGETAEVVWRDGGSHPSPNAGRLEAAFAGALALRLGGLNRYGERIERRPSLGHGQPPSTRDIARAVALSRAVATAAVVLCAWLASEVRR